MNKKYLIMLVVLVLAVALVLTLVACGSKTAKEVEEEVQVEEEDAALAATAGGTGYVASGAPVSGNYQHKNPTASAATASNSSTVVNNTTNNTTNNSSSGVGSSAASKANGYLDNLKDFALGMNQAFTDYQFGKVENAFNAMGSAADTALNAMTGFVGK